ncbi:MAG: carboxymethylenebutenolidase [Tagaea sp. CACIAM 22H2]|nr:carboxymethylenebutenolidase [Tagaea sp. CACIAM 22H2]
MGHPIELQAADGHRFQAWRSDPPGKPKAGLVILQEIFGLNEHIRKTTDSYGYDGYLAIAPALFDRVTPGIELGYGEDDIAKGRDIRAKVPNDKAVTDVAACALALQRAGCTKIAVIGYCWGGTLAWLAAARVTGLDACISYYGGGVVQHLNETARCPVLFHFGETDHSIPMSDVEKIGRALPDADLFVYPAGHGFSCEARGAYDKPSADKARERTKEFLRRYAG